MENRIFYPRSKTRFRATVLFYHANGTSISPEIKGAQNQFMSLPCYMQVTWRTTTAISAAQMLFHHLKTLKNGQNTAPRRRLQCALKASPRRAQQCNNTDSTPTNITLHCILLLAPPCTPFSICLQQQAFYSACMSYKPARQPHVQALRCM